MQIDIHPYKVFQKLKTKYEAKMILITEESLSMQGIHLAFKDHREYVKYQFAKQGIEIHRFGHNYASLHTVTPELGVVYLANDSVIEPGLEAWVLIGHNAKYMPKAEEAKDGL